MTFCLIISELSVNLIEFLAKSDTHALNAHVVAAQNVVKIYKYVLHMVFLIPCHNIKRNDRSKSDN